MAGWHSIDNEGILEITLYLHISKVKFNKFWGRYNLPKSMQREVANANQSHTIDIEDVE